MAAKAHAILSASSSDRWLHCPPSARLCETYEDKGSDYPIQNSSQENSVVIDTFGGSGSTLMACEQLNRVCYMMELDPKYASVILRRYVEDTGDDENVYVIRNGEKLLYSALAKEVETSPTASV